MMKMKNIMVLVVIIISSVFFSSCTSDDMRILFQKPAAEYGEFPFKLVYEIDGEVITVEDTLVIEYEGVGWNEWDGLYTKLNTYWLNQEENAQYYGGTQVKIYYGFFDGEGTRISISLGSCSYYMGLEEESLYYKNHDVKAGDVVISSRPYNGPISDEELYEKYGIRIIEKSLSAPLSEQ